MYRCRLAGLYETGKNQEYEGSVSYIGPFLPNISANIAVNPAQTLSHLEHSMLVKHR